MHKDIQIISASMTGMIMALALAHHGIHSTILERTVSDTFPEDIRTTAFTRKAHKFLLEVGIWELLEDKAGVIKDIYVVDNKSPRILHMGHEDAGTGVMGYIVENNILKERLYKKVRETKLITLKKGVEYNLEEHKDTLTLVCDGRMSPLKKLFKTRLNKDYKQSAIVLVAQHEKPHEGTAVEHFMTSGPFATLPMQDPYKSSVVWTEKPEVASLYQKMSISDITEHLQEKFGEFLGKVKIVSKVQTFPLTANLTKNYVQDNLVLVGDIAHAIHPLAGQGLNQGIKDIEELTGIIAKRVKIGLEIDHIALSEYEKARIRDNYHMFLITDNINRFFSNDIKPLSLIRKLGLSILNESGNLKHEIAAYGMGLK